MRVGTDGHGHGQARTDTDRHGRERTWDRIDRASPCRSVSVHVGPCKSVLVRVRPCTPRFTLVELLLVVAIIAILASLLLPALTGARRRAQVVACASGFRQQAVAAYTYAADRDGLIPMVNSGPYGMPGIAGPGYSVGWSDAQIANALAAHDGARFAAEYLGQPFRFDRARNVMAVPAALVCPGVPRARPFVHSKMPGSFNRDFWTLGEPAYQGIITGNGSLLGLFACDYTYGNNNIVVRHHRFTRFQNPGLEVISMDLTMMRGNLSSWPLGILSTIPHPNGRNDRPEGANQGYADGHVKWIPYNEFNWVYRPGYPWDRQTTIPMHTDPGAQFNRGGYPKLTGYVTAPREFFGMSTTPHGGAFTP